jgi:DNA-binding LacI/PurR family transcriptional regulator
MASQETKVVIAAATFQAGIYITMCDNFKKLFKPEEMTMRSLGSEPEMQKERLRLALVQTKPTALIAMDICPDVETIIAYNNANVPIIVIDEKMSGVSTIATDNLLGGQIAGEYLIKQGRKKLAIVMGRTQIKGGYNAEQRLKGFQQALSAAKLSIQPECMVEVINYSREDGLHVMPGLLDIGVDAIFCAAGDNCAQGLLAVARDRGVRIPEDVAIIGFDDLLIARLSTPALTTIRQPLKEIAEAAYKMAVIQRYEILHKPQNVVLRPEIVIRKSA